MTALPHPITADDYRAAHREDQSLDPDVLARLEGEERAVAIVRPSDRDDCEL